MTPVDPNGGGGDDGELLEPDPGGVDEDVQERASFDRELNVVSDLGCSPDGDEPCNEQLSAALGEDVLFQFPPGEYQFDGPFPIRESARVGFFGAPDGDVRFVPSEGFNSELVDAENVDYVSFRDVTIDVTAPSTTAGLRFITRNGFHVENVTFRGRGTAPADEVTHAFYLAVENPRGQGVLRNAVARQGSAIGHYKGGNGRGGVWIGPAHRGVAYIEDCEFSEFGNNGLYTSRTPGDVRVHGGTFRNNNVSGIRLSGDGSYVVDATVEVDFEDYDGPRSRLDSSFKTRGIVVEQGPFDVPPGVFVRDSSIAIRNTPNPGPAIGVWPTGKTVTVADTTLRADGDTSVVHRRPRVQQGRNSPSRNARGVRLDNVEVEGTSSQYPVVLLEDAPGSELHGCRVAPAGRDRDGVALVRSPASLLDGGEIAASRYPIVLDADFSSAGNCLLLVDRRPTLRSDGDAAETRQIPIVNGASCRSIGGCFSPIPGYACLTGSAVRSLGDSIETIGITDLGDEQAAVAVPRASE